MTFSDKISVILPTYNEKDNILLLIAELHEKLKSYDHEILVVDDNSPDGTYNSVKEKQLPYVRAILRLQNRGLANSIRCGLEEASGTRLVVMDTDFNHLPEDVPFMVNALSFYDCVIGSRYVYGGSMTNMTRYRFSWLFNIFVRFMIGHAITDNISGLFAIRKEALNKLNFDDIFWGYGDYYIRFLYYIQKLKLKIVQFPAAYGRRRGGVSKSRLVHMLVQYIHATFEVALKARFGIDVRRKNPQVKNKLHGI